MNQPRALVCTKHEVEEALNSSIRLALLLGFDFVLQDHFRSRALYCREVGIWFSG